VLYRVEGRQSSASFDDHAEALKFKTLVDKVGPARAMEIYLIEQTHAAGGTRSRAGSTTTSSTSPGSTPLPAPPMSATCATTSRSPSGRSRLPRWHEDIARWINELDGSGKTIRNKHGFLAGASRGLLQSALSEALHRLARIDRLGVSRLIIRILSR
jgi:integrase